jgi:hypothetical protein
MLENVNTDPADTLRRFQYRLFVAIPLFDGLLLLWSSVAYSGESGPPIPL